MRSAVNPLNRLAFVLSLSCVMAAASVGDARAHVALVIVKVEVSYDQGLPDRMTITGVNFGTVPGAVVLDSGQAGD